MTYVTVITATRACAVWSASVTFEPCQPSLALLRVLTCESHGNDQRDTGTESPAAYQLPNGRLSTHISFRLFGASSLSGETARRRRILTKVGFMRREVKQGTSRGRRHDHWVYLDRWWAQRLGVTRTAGMYRIRSRDLLRRLSQETLGVDASGNVYAYRTTPAATSADSGSGVSRNTRHPTPPTPRAVLTAEQVLHSGE